MKKVDTRPFHFKQFSLYHHRSTMKVGTDSVLLGVWVRLQGVRHALDIGTGSGILSLLLAARSQCRIDAVELDQPSYEEAKVNFEASPFSGQLHVHHADFNTFARQANRQYDLIISNPPFFINDRKPDNQHKRMARHAETLTYEQLIEGSMDLLNPSGRLSVVLPYREGLRFMSIASEKGLSVQRQLLIFPKPCVPPNRMNLQFGWEETPLEKQKFIIRNESGDFTGQYHSFLKDFYLSI